MWAWSCDWLNEGCLVRIGQGPNAGIFVKVKERAASIFPEAFRIL